MNAAAAENIASGAWTGSLKPCHQVPHSNTQSFRHFHQRIHGRRFLAAFHPADENGGEIRSYATGSAVNRKMIESEIREITKDPRRLAFLADEFRRDRDICDLLALLNSKDDEILGVAAWIAAEVKIAPTEAQLVISRLHQLVNHEKPSVRFHAIGALFPFLNKSDPAAKEMLTRLSNDPNEGVRAIANAALERMSSKSLR